MRVIRYLAVALALGLVVTACSDSSGSEDGDKVTIEWWQPDTRDDWVASRDLVIDKFEKQNPDIKVKVVTVPYDQLDTKVQGTVVTKKSPDLVLGYGSVTTGWAFAGISRPLDDVVESIGSGSISEAGLTSATIDGKVYGLATWSSPQLLWYRKDWFDKAGIKPPTTWDELIAAAKQFTAGDRFGWIMYNKAPDSNMVLSAIDSSGGTTFDADGNVVIDSPAAVEGVSRMVELAKYAPDGSLSNTEDDARLQFSEGCCAMTTTSTSFMNDVAADPGGPAKFGAVQIPLDEGSKFGSYGAFYHFMIPKAADPDHLAATKKFLEFWFQDDVMTEWAKRTVIGFIPSMPAVATSPAYLESDRVAPVSTYMKAGAAAAETAFTGGQEFGPNKCAGKVLGANVWGELLDRPVLKGESPEAAAAWAAKKIKELCP